MCQGCSYPGRLVGSIVMLLWPHTCMLHPLEAAELGPLVEDQSRLMLWHADSEAQQPLSQHLRLSHKRAELICNHGIWHPLGHRLLLPRKGGGPWSNALLHGRLVFLSTVKTVRSSERFTSQSRTTVASMQNSGMVRGCSTEKTWMTANDSGDRVILTAKLQDLISHVCHQNFCLNSECNSGSKIFSFFNQINAKNRLRTKI